MRYTFKDESTLDVCKYLLKKQSLYCEASEEVEDLIVRRLHNGLNLTLAAIVSLRPYRNRIDDFQKKVYNAEPAARAQWKQTQDTIKTLVAAAEA